MTAEIISVGTELLMGEILNTNAEYLSRRLRECGISVYYQVTVGDNRERLAGCFLTALKRSDIVLITGGLGPTEDDITKETVAESLGLPMRRNADVMEKIRGYFASLGRNMTVNNEKQADIPCGAEILENSRGTAPGVYIKTGEKHVFIMPGVPSEMCEMFENAVMPVLEGFSEMALVSHDILIFGVGEAEVDSRIVDLTAGADPTVAPYCGTGEVRLRVASRGDGAEQKCETVINEIRARFGRAVVGVDRADLQTVVVGELGKRNLRLATAESCTGGLIAQKITSVPGASAVFDFGACVYANPMKEKLLGVGRDVLEERGAVSAEVAEQMAVGVRKYAGADLGLSVTGVAGPASSENKPVGLVYLALASADKIYHKELKLFSKSYTRDKIRELTARHGLDMVRRAVWFGTVE